MTSITKHRSRERTQAQGECYRFLNAYGWAEKHYDAMRCSRCHAILTDHINKHAPDYSAVLTRPGKDELAAWVEVKAAPGTGEVFSFSAIEEGQWERAALIHGTFPGRMWFWIQMGNEIDDDDLPRTAYLIPYVELVRTRKVLNGVAKVDTFAMREDDISRVAAKKERLCAEVMWKDYALQWDKEAKSWKAREGHAFNQQLK